MAPLPTSPNCVSTTTDQLSKRMDPLPYTRDSKTVLRIIEDVILAQPRTAIVEVDERNLRVVSTFTSKLCGYVDDVVFALDDRRRLVHFRSASRVGYGDMGVNRKRMTQLSELLRGQI